MIVDVHETEHFYYNERCPMNFELTIDFKSVRKYSRILWFIFDRKSTFRCLFTCSEVNWTWWRRSSLHIKAFPLLIERTTTKRKKLIDFSMLLTFTFVFSDTDHNSKSILFSPNHWQLYVILFNLIISWTNNIKEIMKSEPISDSTFN